MAEQKEQDVKIEAEENIKKSRSFKVKLEKEGEAHGRYNGDSPYQAANKALSEIIRNRVTEGKPVDQDIEFYLIESTKGRVKKIHHYSGKRIKLDDPVKYTVANGQEIIKEYKNNLRKIKKVGAQKGGAVLEVNEEEKKEEVKEEVKEEEKKKD